MVAITVILAAVIGTFVLGLGDQVSDSAPQASFDFEFKNESAFSVTHEGGDTVKNSSLKVLVGSTEVYEGDGDLDGSWDYGDGDSWNDDVSSGDTLTLNETGDNDQTGETVRIVWSSSSGGDSNTIAKAEWP